MKRYNYDKSHFSIMCGDIGRLQCHTVIPVIAGESLQIDFGGVFRLSSLRRSLVLDAHVDSYCFYMPFRHAYGSDWTDFLIQGVDESVTFTSGPTQTAASYLGFRSLGSGNFPLWVTTGPNRIFNEYFRAPTVAADILADNALDGTVRGEKFGPLCGRLPNPWTTGIEGEPAAADREVPSATVMDLVDLAAFQGRYKTELERSFDSTRYREIIKSAWGGRANTDADERPTLLMRSKTVLSGYDVDGTGDANLGSFSGKSAAIIKMRVPRRLFPEHGAVWIFSLVRFPTVFQQESDFLMNTANPSYEDFAGDPEIVDKLGPEAMLANRYFSTTSTTDYGSVPAGQHYRYHGNVVHQCYANLQGYPFISPFPGNAAIARYFADAEYDNVFSTSQLGQWNSQSHISIKSQSPVPPARTTLMAGTR